MNPSPGLAYGLCGGADRCMFQIPSLVASERLGVYPAEVFAASAGAANALGFALEKAARLEEIWFTIKPKRLYKFSYESLFVEPLKKGRWPIIGAEAIFSAKALNGVLDKEVDFEAALRSPIKIWISVADLISGELLWFSNHDEGMTVEFFRAVALGTMRIPVFWKPAACFWKGREYQFADPGLIMNIPVRKAVERGFSNIVVIETAPRKFSPVQKLQTIGEVDLRYSEMGHLYEADGDLKWLEYINNDILVLEEMRAVLSDPRVPPEVLAAVELKQQGYTFSGKSVINICRMNPPAKLSIFHKTRRKYYGSPSVAARSELLGAGMVAAEEILLPFLKKQGMLSNDAELPADWF